MKNKKIIYICYCFLIIFLSSHIVIADEITDNIGNSFNVDKYVSTFDEYLKKNEIEDIQIKEIYSDLINGEGVNYDFILDKIANNLISQIKTSIKSVSTLLVIIIILAVISSLELDKNSDVIRITRLIVLVCVSSILLKNYIEIVNIFNNVINTMSLALQTVSTFLMGILIANGKITSIGIIQPILLFISNFICVITKYIVIPFFTISIVINIVSRISENIKLDSFSSMFRKLSLYIFSTCIAVFVLVLSMETSVTKSIDNMYFKTTQNIISNTVPVVGKFLSDSLNTVLGATELIGKVGGIVSIISILLIVGIPVIKIVVIVFLYKILIAFSEPINTDDNIIKFIEGFEKVYKDMLGILIGVMVLVLMTTGILMSLISRISV